MPADRKPRLHPETSSPSKTGKDIKAGPMRFAVLIAR